MVKQNDWWMLPPGEIGQRLLNPLLARVNEAVGQAMSRVDRELHGESRACPPLGEGVEVTAADGAWELGDQSDALISGDGAKETVQLTVAEGCGTSGGVRVTLAGEDYVIALDDTDNDTAAKVATAIGDFFDALPGFDDLWDVAVEDDVVIVFEAADAGCRGADHAYDPGETGADGDIVVLERGYGDKPFSVTRVVFEDLSDAGVFVLVLYAAGQEIARLRTASVGVVAVTTPVLPPGAEVTARAAYSEGGDNKAVTVSVGFCVYDPPAE